MCKTVITVTDILLFAFPKVQTILFSLSTVYTLWVYWVELPLMVTWMNPFRCSFAAVHAWVAVMGTVVLYAVDAEMTGYKKHEVFWEYASQADYLRAKAITKVRGEG